MGAYLSVQNDTWVLDSTQITPFIKARVEAMTKSGYLKPDKTVGHYIYFNIVGGKDEYNAATELMMGVKK